MPMFETAAKARGGQMFEALLNLGPPRPWVCQTQPASGLTWEGAGGWTMTTDGFENNLNTKPCRAMICGRRRCFKREDGGGTGRGRVLVEGGGR